MALSCGRSYKDNDCGMNQVIQFVTIPRLLASLHQEWWWYELAMYTCFDDEIPLAASKCPPQHVFENAPCDPHLQQDQSYTQRQARKHLDVLRDRRDIKRKKWFPGI